MDLKYFRTVFSILTLLAILLSAPAPAGAADSAFRIYADSVSAGQGEDIAVRFSLTNQYAVSSFTVPLAYDSGLVNLKSISFTGSRAQQFANKLISPSSIANIHGHFMVSAFLVFEDPIPAGDGLLFTAVFHVNPTASVGATAVIDTLFYPPGGSLVVVRADQPGAIEPLFTAGKITVGEANRSPMFASMADQYVLEGDSLVLPITVADPDHDPVAIAITSKPAGASFVDHGDGTARLVWVPDYVGPNSADGSPKQISFWASDGDLSSRQDVNVYVINRNRAPRINGPSSVSAEAGDSLLFSVSALDPDFETVSWSWSGLPQGAHFDAANPGHFAWQPALTDSGQTAVKFVAADPQGLKDTLNVNLSVRAVALYTLSLDSVTGKPGETVDFSVRLDNRYPVASFNVLFNCDASALSMLSLGATGTRAESFEYFSVTQNDKSVPGNIRIVGIADIGGGGLLAAGDGSIADGQLRISSDLAFAGFSVPLYFQYQDAPVNVDNTLTDSVGTKIPQSGIYYIPGDVQIQEIGNILIGDINLNRIAAEIADVIYFTNYFINPLLYQFDALQYANSDVNRDGLPATVADLVALINWVVSGVQPGLSGAALSNGDDAAIWQQRGDRSLTVGYEAPVDMGGVLLTLRTAGTVRPDMIENLAPDMDFLFRQDGDKVNILMYSLKGAELPSGHTNLVTISGLNDLTVVGAQLGATDGRLVSVSLEAASDQLPSGFALAQNYPNPFNPETVIEYSLPASSDVELTIYNVLGQRVRDLVTGFQTAGDHSVLWDGADDRGERVSSGVYFYRLTAGANTMTRKMMLLK